MRFSIRKNRWPQKSLPTFRAAGPPAEKSADCLNQALNKRQRIGIPEICGYNSAYLPHVILVPRCRDTLARRVRPGFVRARGNASLAQLAHVPVLLVYHVPELNGIIRIKFVARVGDPGRFRIKEPIAEDQCSFWRLRFKLMHHSLIR